jgi:hypothetical protein
MSPKHKELLLHYSLVLAIILTCALAYIVIPHPLVRTITVTTIVVTYCLWSLWHHYENETLTRDVVLEYGAVLGIFLVVLLFLS